MERPDSGDPRVYGYNPFSQARFMAIIQLAVFEAVNAITGRYRPYLGTIAAPEGASAEAAAVAAAHAVLYELLPRQRDGAQRGARASSLAAIPDGPAKADGIATGEAAAARHDRLARQRRLRPRGVLRAGPARAGRMAGYAELPDRRRSPCRRPSPLAQRDSVRHRARGRFSRRRRRRSTGSISKDYVEVLRVGSVDSTERPSDRADVARFYAASSPSQALNSAARQVAAAQRRSLSHNARALALINMAVSDSLVASFLTKYHYNFWRPETAIRLGDTDGNPKTRPDPDFAPFITTPCFPSYPSNHASGTTGGAEMMRRLYGAGGHDDHPDERSRARRDPALHDVQSDHRRRRRRARLRRNPFPVRSGGGWSPGTQVAAYTYKHTLRSSARSE